MTIIERIKNSAWLKAAGVRAIKTMAQTAASALGVTYYFYDVDWRAVISAAALAGILSMLTSLAGLPEAVEEGA